MVASVVARVTFSAALIVASSLLLPSMVAASTVATAPPSTNAAGELALLRPSVGNPSSPSNNSLNNTTSYLSSSITSFVNWFFRGLGTVIEIAFGVLIVGGIVNYVLVGRKRGKWTPVQAAQATGIGAFGQAPGSPGTTGPPPGPGAP